MPVGNTYVSDYHLVFNTSRFREIRGNFCVLGIVYGAVAWNATIHHNYRNLALSRSLRELGVYALQAVTSKCII